MFAHLRYRMTLETGADARAEKLAGLRSKQKTCEQSYSACWDGTVLKTRKHQHKHICREDIANFRSTGTVQTD